MYGLVRLSLFIAPKSSQTTLHTLTLGRQPSIWRPCKGAYSIVEMPIAWRGHLTLKLVYTYDQTFSTIIIIIIIIIGGIFTYKSIWLPSL